MKHFTESLVLYYYIKQEDERVKSKITEILKS